MTSKVAHATIRRPSVLLRLLGSANASPSCLNHGRTLFCFGQRALSADSAVGPPPPLRRRRRRGGIGGSADEQTSRAARERPAPGEAAAPAAPDGGGAFSPVGPDGAPLDAQEYLALASLSPWVPCPDLACKRALEIAGASAGDVHADLGCGDGRLNFAAVGGPYHVRSSWGVDVDENILEKCRERMGRRFVPSGFGGDGGGPESGDASSEAGRLEFLQADLIKVMERQKEEYQRRQRLDSQDASSSTPSEAPSLQLQDYSKEDEITRRLSQSTIVTMYFVDDALKQLKPYLASVLGGRENVRVVTVGYEMKGWDASWVERVLGLTIFKYDMKDVSNDPAEWRDGDDEELEEEGTTELIDPDDDFTLFGNGDGDPEGAVAEYLQKKREADMKELNEGLKIHHDEALDEFAQSRARRDSSPMQGLDDLEREEEEDWDFDETEDPEDLMREEERRRAEERRGGRGRGMMAGLGSGATKARKEKTGAKKKPVWKKP